MKKTLIIIIPLIIVITIIGVLLSIKSPKEEIKYEFPKINITLNDISLEEINKGSKETKYPNNKIEITYQNKTTNYSNITIKGRGNHTWKLDKKPYQIKFEKKESILGLPKSNKFILLANAEDSSLLRTDVTFNIAKRMNIKGSFTGEFIDLYVDNDYIGNYYVVPKISFKSDIFDFNTDDAVLIELDNKTFEEDDYFITNTYNDHLLVKEVKNDETLSSFKEKYNLMEKYLEEDKYQELEKIIDIDSFATYYLLSEFIGNGDALESSLFFYMENKNDKIHIGPMWDVDLAYGIVANYHNSDTFYIGEGILLKKGYSTALFNKLLKYQDFNNRVEKIWNNNAKPAIEKELSELDNKISYLQERGSINNDKWHQMKYDLANKSFKDWLNDRYKLFKEVYGDQQ